MGAVQWVLGAWEGRYFQGSKSDPDADAGPCTSFFVLITTTCGPYVLYLTIFLLSYLSIYTSCVMG
jgi:hypothetical protein